MKKVKYRLDINYYSQDYPDACCEISKPIYTMEEGKQEYLSACEEKCLDNPDMPARVHLWKYQWSDDGKCNPLTIAKNF